MFRKSFHLFGLLLITMLVMVACQPVQKLSETKTAAAAAAQTPLEQANQAVAQRFYDEVFTQKKMEVLGEIFDANLVIHDLDVGGELGGATLLADTLTAFPDVKATVNRWVVEGDLVTAYVTYVGTHQAEFLGVASTGKVVTWSIIDIMRVQNGRIAELWHDVPNGDILEQIQPEASSTMTGAATTTGAASALTPLEQANQAVVQRFYDEVVNKKNLAVFAEVFDPNMAEHSLGIGVILTDTEILAAFPDLQLTVDMWMVEGDLVTAVVTTKGTHQAEFMGVAPTGNPISWSSIDIWRVQDGKITDVWHDVPNEDILQQIGYTLVPPVNSMSDSSEMTSDPAVIVKAFYDTMNNLEYEKAMAYFADEVVTINPSGAYTGTEANLAQYTEAWEAGIRLELSSLRNVDGIVVAHVKVFEQGTLIVEGDNSITIVEAGKITFDGDTSNMPPMVDPTSPIAVLKAFYVALNAKEYDNAMNFVADDATLTDAAGSYQGKDKIAARIVDGGNGGYSYDIWDLREVDGTVSYKARVYQDDTVLYETTGSDLVKHGKITLTSTAK